EGYKKALESLAQKHIQLEKQLEGLTARRQTAIKNQKVNKELLKSYKNLFSKGHLKKSDLLGMEAKDSESESHLVEIESDIARIKEAITEDEANTLKIKSDYLAKILEELSKTHVLKNEALEKYNAAKDVLDKIILRSPVDGTVIEMHATTIGGVLGPGNPVAEILPLNDTLIVEAKIASKDIASVHVGLKAKIKFSAFKSRTTPVFSGVVASLSPDVVYDKSPDPRQQEPSYIAKIEIDMDDFNRVGKKNKLYLRPGMQVEVNIVTGTRTLARYLLDPITDSMFRAFKEK
ncbi:MAG: HlyD family type I secretion periplasmic adaptor subunit, partial [Rickettsiaceae bacterium]|nr:HlyD family type I secretion periplasmic adaptor subunit [Rickettsiaceae bacterium]